MNNQQKDIFFQIHQGIPRECPGEFESTKNAFLKLIDLPLHPKIIIMRKLYDVLKDYFQ